MYKPVKVLDPQTARKIAAGEVIDRPAAVVRELLDNALDSGASKIYTEIASGGIACIRITDNGCGMSREDLAICTDTHTTSKISAADDLLKLNSFGFRGEALSSIKAVSNLEITSTRQGPIAWKLQFGELHPARLHVGTIVQVENLFENFPARLQFLKRPATESTLCRSVFLDKALPHYSTEMRFVVDGVEKFRLLPVSSLKQRCLDVFSFKEPDEFFYQIEGSGEHFSFQVVLGSPDVLRNDKRSLFIFVNGRRIGEYGLVQALEYGSEGYFPNGAHPVSFLFLTVNPARVDFNIHPAKKEARFQDYGAIHHAISSTVSAFYRQYTVSRLLKGGCDNEGFAESLPFPEKTASATVPLAYNPLQSQKLVDSTTTVDPPAQACLPDSGNTLPAYERALPVVSAAAAEMGVSYSPHDVPPPHFRLLGQAAGTFIVIEMHNSIYLIDQHAAHERIIFEELKQHAGETQELLIPYRITTCCEEDDALIRGHVPLLKKHGFIVSDEGGGVWLVHGVPIRWKGTEQDLIRDITDARKHAHDMLNHILASASCRAACKDGDMLDAAAMHRIVVQALSLPEPLCPHGRPIWTVLTREELFRRVRRT